MQYALFSYSERNNRIFGYTGMEQNDEMFAKYTYMIQNGAAVHAPDCFGYKTTYADISDGYVINLGNLNKLSSGTF